MRVEEVKGLSLDEALSGYQEKRDHICKGCKGKIMWLQRVPRIIGILMLSPADFLFFFIIFFLFFRNMRCNEMQCNDHMQENKCSCY